MKCKAHIIIVKEGEMRINYEDTKVATGFMNDE
jgi:hypothetical protein